MTYAGEVRGGVVVLDDGVSLPDGAKVSVELIIPVPDHPDLDPAEPGPLLKMADLAVDTGIPDLGYNIDHYLYGHPRKPLPKADDGD